MRATLSLLLVLFATATMAEETPPASDAAATAAPAAAPDAPALSAPAKGACANPNALGVTRTVEIDTTGGPGFGLQQYKAYDFLHDKEVVLTFDDGPHLTTRKAILDALD